MQTSEQQISDVLTEFALTIVAKTIELAEMLDLAIACEGVETREQFRQVQALTSDYRQGFLFSRPMTARSVDQFAGATAGTSPWSISV